MAARLRAQALLSHKGALEASILELPPVRPFEAALRGAHVSVIAELKRRSPSKGSINEGLDVPSRASAYQSAGAAALSVLTEPVRFGGSLDDLRAACAVTTIPLLRKDFIVDRLQLLEARAAGASAVLLIARALPPSHRATLASEAHALGLEVLLEVRDEVELEHALSISHAVIGINNRNLETLQIDDVVSERLLPLVPEARTAVYESGVRDRTDVERAGSLGANAVLVGSSLSSTNDGGAAAVRLTGVARRSRG